MADFKIEQDKKKRQVSRNNRIFRERIGLEKNVQKRTGLRVEQDKQERGNHKLEQEI
jgi:hypothetical protein